MDVDDPSSDDELDAQKHGLQVAILFAIDCHPSMLGSAAKPEGPSSLNMALQCVVDMLQSACVVNNGTLFGVMLFNTNMTKSSQGINGIHVLYPLQKPSSDMILSLEQLIEDSTKFDSTVGSVSATVQLHGLFREALSIFNHRNTKTLYRKLFLITNNDDPHAGDVSTHESAKAGLQDVRDNNVHISAFFIVPPGYGFDAHKFWLEALTPEKESTLYSIPSDVLDSITDSRQLQLFQARQLRSYYMRLSMQISSTFDDLLIQVQREGASQRAMYRVPFRLTTQTTIGVRVYAMYTKRNKPQIVRVVEATGMRVKKIASYISEDMGNPLVEAEDTLINMQYAGTEISFTKEEYNMLMKFEEPGLQLLGFESTSLLNSIYGITHSVFIFPDEELYTNSIVTFIALLDQMKAQQKVAIVKFQPAKTSVPRLAALLPQIEQCDENGMVSPSGFHVILLPYKDNIRAIPKMPLLKANPELCDLMRPIVDRFRAKQWTPSVFEDPALRRFYHILHAKALDKKREEVTDTTQPRYDIWNKRLLPFVLAVHEAFPSMISGGYKRKASSLSNPLSDYSSLAKKRRDDNGNNITALVTPDGLVNMEQLKKTLTEDTLSERTLNELKALLRAVGNKTTGNKSAILERIGNHFAGYGF